MYGLHGKRVLASVYTYALGANLDSRRKKWRVHREGTQGQEKWRCAKKYGLFEFGSHVLLFSRVISYPSVDPDGAYMRTGIDTPDDGMDIKSTEQPSIKKRHSNAHGLVFIFVGFPSSPFSPMVIYLVPNMTILRGMIQTRWEMDDSWERVVGRRHVFFSFGFRNLSLLLVESTLHTFRRIAFSFLSISQMMLTGNAYLSILGPWMETEKRNTTFRSIFSFSHKHTHCCSCKGQLVCGVQNGSRNDVGATYVPFPLFSNRHHQNVQ